MSVLDTQGVNATELAMKELNPISKACRQGLSSMWELKIVLGVSVRELAMKELNQQDPSSKIVLGLSSLMQAQAMKELR